MSDYKIIREYRYPVDEVWEVMTTPEWVAKWTTTGQGGRPEDFEAVVGQKFRFVGKPTMGWAGVVYCEVKEVDAPRMLHYTWKGDQESDDVTDVRYILESTEEGTRFTWDHTGFTGIGGFAMSRLLSSVRRKMMQDGVPPVLAELHSLRKGRSA